MGTSVSSTPVKGANLPGARGVGPDRPPAVGASTRRRPGWLWAGLGTVVVSAIGFTLIATNLSGRDEVLMLAKDVPAGHVLTTKDLRTVQAAADAGVVSADDRAVVLGREAKVPLVAGSLLAAGHVGEKSNFPPVGWSQVSLAVETGAAPSDLALGERVGVLPGPSGTAPGKVAADAERPPAAVIGTVTGVKAAESAGAARVVTVLVETGAARRATAMEHPRIVVLSAEGRDAP